MHVFDVQRVFSSEANVHHANPPISFSPLPKYKSGVVPNLPNLVQVLPKLHLAGIRAQLSQVRPQEHLSMQNLRAVLVGNLIERAFERGASCGEGSSGDVVLEELLVDDVDNGGDEGLDVFRTSDESFNVA